MTGKPKLLFLSPITPATTGNGLAMRAGSFLQALAEDFDVYLLVVPTGRGARNDCPGDLAPLCLEISRLQPGLAATFFGRLCHHPLIYPLLGRFYRHPTEWRMTSKATIRSGLRLFEHVGFDHIHVFRLYLYPYARAYAELDRNRDATLHLDLDEIESATRLKLATIESHGTRRRRLRRDAVLYRGLEAGFLPACDRVYVCSAEDRESLRTRLGLDRISILPNTVRLRKPAEDSVTHQPCRLLFVGNLNYLPNRDALCWFADEVLPILRCNAGRPFRLLIVGAGKHPQWRRLAKIPEFDFKGFAPSVEPAYKEADVVVVPLRAGGGTRIKVLEALAFGKPVVSTRIGAAGLELKDGVDLLLADGAHRFAAACAKLLLDEALRKTLGLQGRDKVRIYYSQEAFRSKIRKVGIKRRSESSGVTEQTSGLRPA